MEWTVHGRPPCEVEDSGQGQADVRRAVTGQQGGIQAPDEPAQPSPAQPSRVAQCALRTLFPNTFTRQFHLPLQA